MWSGKTSDGVLPDLFSGTYDAMPVRVRDEETPKKPKPVRDDRYRRTTNVEAGETEPWLPLRKDSERDHHRHI